MTQAVQVLYPLLRTILVAVLLGSSFSSAVLAQSTESNDPNESMESSEPTPQEIALANSLLMDRNGNGVVDIAAFGDSLTRGTGDFTEAGEEVFSAETPAREAGYPLRVEQFADVPVTNLGVPGERVTSAGLARFAATIPDSRPDIVVLGGGANDAIFQVSSQTFRHTMQTMLNISYAVGATPVLTTIVPPCCDRSGIALFANQYNAETLLLAQINDVPVADIHRSFRSTCNVAHCELLNLPEGLHPNVEGYDVIGETVLAALYNINIHAADGPMLLEQALNLQEGSIKTIPDEPASVPSDEENAEENSQETMQRQPHAG